jgi:hypothetical protein
MHSRILAFMHWISGFLISYLLFFLIHARLTGPAGIPALVSACLYTDA